MVSACTPGTGQPPAIESRPLAGSAAGATGSEAQAQKHSLQSRQG